jgi:hypothetical protein
VRGLEPHNCRLPLVNPHPPLSLRKGEATRCTYPIQLTIDQHYPVSRRNPESACNRNGRRRIIEKIFEQQDQSPRGLDSRRSASADRLGLVCRIWRDVVELSRQDDDRHRADAQPRAVHDRDRRVDLCQLCAGLADQPAQYDKCDCRIENRNRLLVRVSICGIRDHFGVLRV